MDVVAGDGMGERGGEIRSEIDELIDRLNESFVPFSQSIRLMFDCFLHLFKQSTSIHSS